MSDIRPFRAIRPNKKEVAAIAALPYDVFSREEASEYVKNRPLSFLNIDRPETQFPNDYDMYAPEVYQKAHDLLWNMVAEQSLIRENTPCYYLYQLTMNNRSQTGIVAVSAIDDYLENRIKKHEFTRVEKEQDRIRHIDTCNAQTGPIFLAYRSQESINEVVREVEKETPIYDFKTEDNVIHRVWIISEEKRIERIRSAFSSINDIYIADGHHRAASAVKVGLKRRKEDSNPTGEEEYQFFLSVLFPDEQLRIMDYNRAVKDLNGLTKEDFLDKVKKRFIVEENTNQDKHPKKAGEITMLLDGVYYTIALKKEDLTEDPVEGLDVALLQHLLLQPILGIGDPRTDKRIDFVGGIRGLEELERRCNTDCKVAFAVYPTTMSQLFAVADAERVMPPKSTWFEPKLRSGLFIHEI